MEKGVLVEVGPAAQVLNEPRHPYTQRRIDAVPRRRSSERRYDVGCRRMIVAGPGLPTS
jgi:ABC-type glutathione transport system ATPase component